MEALERDQHRVRFVDDDISRAKAQAKAADSAGCSEWTLEPAAKIKAVEFEPVKDCGSSAKQLVIFVEHDDTAFARMKAAAEEAERLMIRVKEHNARYEHGWRPMQRGGKKAIEYDPDDDSPEAQDIAFLRNLPHPKSREGVEVVNGFKPVIWISGSQRPPQTFLGVFNGVCIPCLLINGESMFPLNYFQKKILSARGKRGTWDLVNDAIIHLNIMVRCATGLEIQALDKLAKKLLEDEHHYPLITRSDAERIYSLLYSKSSSRPASNWARRKSTLLMEEKLWDVSERVPIQHNGIVGDLDIKEAFSDKGRPRRPTVYGWLFPSRASGNRRCVLCAKCKLKLTLADFCKHGHYSEKAADPRSRIVVWGFNSSNWFYYIRIAEPLDQVLSYRQFWEEFLSLQLEPKQGCKRRKRVDVREEIEDRKSITTQTSQTSFSETWSNPLKFERLSSYDTPWSYPDPFLRRWGFRACPNKSLVSAYQKLSCKDASLAIKCLLPLVNKEVAFIQMVLAEASHGRIAGFDPAKGIPSEQLARMLPLLPAKPSDFVRPEELNLQNDDGAETSGEEQLDREIEEIEAMIGSKDGTGILKCLEKIKKLKTKCLQMQQKTDVVTREYNRIYRNYNLLHASYQTVMDPATHIDLQVQRQLDLVKEEQLALKNCIPKQESRDSNSEAPPILIPMLTLPTSAAAIKDNINPEVIEISNSVISRAITANRPNLVHKPIPISESREEVKPTIVMLGEKGNKYLDKQLRTIDSNSMTRNRLIRREAPLFSIGHHSTSNSAPSSSLPAPSVPISTTIPATSYKIPYQPTTKQRKLSPSSYSHTISPRLQPATVIPTTNHQQNVFLAPGQPKQPTPSFMSPLLSINKDSQLPQQASQIAQQPNFLQLHQLLGLVSGPSSTPVQQQPTLNLTASPNLTIQGQQSAFLPATTPQTNHEHLNPYTQLAASLTPSQLQVQLEATQRILQANQQPPPSLLPSGPAVSMPLPSGISGISSSGPSSLTLFTHQLQLPLANRDAPPNPSPVAAASQLSLGSAMSINLLDSLLRQQQQSNSSNPANGNSSSN